jgi:hypothetical protein
MRLMRLKDLIRHYDFVVVKTDEGERECSPTEVKPGEIVELPASDSPTDYALFKILPDLPATPVQAVESLLGEDDSPPRKVLKLSGNFRTLDINRETGEVDGPDPDDVDMSPTEVKAETIKALNDMRDQLSNASVMLDLANISQMDGYPGKAYATLGRSGDVANEIIDHALEWANSIPEREFNPEGSGDPLYAAVCHYLNHES